MEIRSGNYCYRVVGSRIPIHRGDRIRPFWIEDGTIEFTWEGSVHPRWATPAERAAHRATLPAQMLPPPPYQITEDTTFGVAAGPGVRMQDVRGPNFEQELPHTEVFTVAPGVRAVFEKGNFTNCTLPDEVADADIGNIQNIQGVLTPTSHARFSTVRTLAEDEVTATFSKALSDAVASGAWARPIEEGGLGRRLGLVKPLARARRDAGRGSSDLTALRAENAAALARKEAIPENEA